MEGGEREGGDVVAEGMRGRGPRVERQTARAGRGGRARAQGVEAKTPRGGRRPVAGRGTQWNRIASVGDPNKGEARRRKEVGRLLHAPLRATSRGGAASCEGKEALPPVRAHPARAESEGQGGAASCEARVRSSKFEVRTSKVEV